MICLSSSVLYMIIIFILYYHTWFECNSDFFYELNLSNLLFVLGFPIHYFCSVYLSINLLEIPKFFKVSDWISVFRLFWTKLFIIIFRVHNAGVECKETWKWPFIFLNNSLNLDWKGSGGLFESFDFMALWIFVPLRITKVMPNPPSFAGWPRGSGGIHGTIKSNSELEWIFVPCRTTQVVLSSPAFEAAQELLRHPFESRVVLIEHLNRHSSFQRELLKSWFQ